MNNLAVLPLAFGVPGWPEVVVIALIILLFFGGKKIPELTKSLIQSAKEIRSAVRQGEETVTEVVNAVEPKQESLKS